MARFDFGGTLADFVVTSRRLGGLDTLALSAATLTFWDSQSGGARYTNLVLNGSAVASITVGSDGQVPKFQGPDGVTEMWVDGGSPRVRLVTLQGAPGPVGPEGAASAVPGPTGPTGSQGPQGLPGVNAVDNDTAVAGYVSTAGTSSTKTALDARYVGKGSLLVNAKDYGVKGDGITDDTTALAAAITATPVGGVTFIPGGTYLHNGLTGKSGTILRGAGAKNTTLKTAAGATVTNALNMSGRTDVIVEDIGFDGSSHATTLSGVYASTNGTQKNLTVARCRFVNFMPGTASTTHGAVYTWTSDGITVRDSEFIGCGRGVNIGTAGGHVNVLSNRITATQGASLGAGTMATGIMVRDSGGPSEGKVLIQGNYVSGATLDTAANGAEGHGITVYRTRDAQVIGNHCYNNGRGILISFLSFGGIVQGNTTAYNWDSGIRCEPQISTTDVTVGTAGVARGIVIVGNVSRDNTPVGTPSGGNTGIGITMSYAAGSIVQGNICFNNGGDGIASDSDRMSIIGNTCYNNWKTSTPTAGNKAGIRAYAGANSIIMGNTCFDNQTTKTQQYGLSVGAGGHIVGLNSFAGNGTAEVDTIANTRTSFYGSAPVTKPASPGTATGTDAAIINALVTSLRSLGLIT